MSQEVRPMSRLRTLLAYVGLVGVPTVGVVGVVHHGPSEPPSAHVGGSWTFTGAEGCVGAGLPLSIDQSGRFLRIAGVERASATVDHDRVRLVLPQGTGACAGHTATIDGVVAEDGRLVGELQVEGCASCPSPAAIVGTRSGGAR